MCTRSYDPCNAGPALAPAAGMSRFVRTGLVWALLFAGCTFASDPGAPSDDPSDDPGDGAEDTPPPVLPDDFATPDLPAPDDGWVPKAFTATRFGVFYQISQDVLDRYQAPGTGLPQVAGHAYIITQSHAVAFASKVLADLVHRRADFYYAPAFDVWDASHDGWQTASAATLAQWGHEFRDAAIHAHADLFTFNEAPTTTGSSANVRIQIARILRAIHEPDAQGRQLFGVTYFTQKPSIAANWTEAGSDLFKAIDETSVALVVEYYHSNGYVCGTSTTALADHYFSLRRWLVASGEPAKLSIANTKFTVLHSARFDDGPSGWAGGDATRTTLANFQRALSRAAQVTRATEGGVNRLAFGPVATSITQFGVQPRITALFRWHYLHTAAQASEATCIDAYAGNCTCE